MSTDLSEYPANLHSLIAEIYRNIGLSSTST